MPRTPSEVELERELDRLIAEHNAQPEHEDLEPDYERAGLREADAWYASNYPV